MTCLVDTGRAVFEVQPHPQQRVGAGPDPADRPTRRGAAAEEGLEHVAEPAEAAEAVACRTRGRQRIAAEVDDASLLRIAEHLVGDADLLEARLRLLVGVDVGMQFAGQLAVGALDLRITRALAHPEQAVIVACHSLTFPTADAVLSVA